MTTFPHNEPGTNSANENSDGGCHFVLVCACRGSVDDGKDLWIQLNLNISWTFFIHMHEVTWQRNVCLPNPPKQLQVLITLHSITSLDEALSKTLLDTLLSCNFL